MAREARKSLGGTTGASAQETRIEITRNLNLAAHLAHELAALLDAQAKNPTEDFTSAITKMAELQNAMAQIKTKLS